MASLDMIQSFTTAKNASFDDATVSSADNLNPVYELSSLSEQNHSTNNQSEIQDDTYIRNYKPVYNTLYMIAVVNYYCKKTTEFTIKNYAPEAIQNKCACCFCKNDLINHEGFKDFMHPHEEACQRDESKPKLTQSKYTKQTICVSCMSFMTINSKKSSDLTSKNKKYHCCFNSCTDKLKTKAQLQNHYLKHLKVKNFECPICPRVFTSKSGLKLHERKHLNC